PEYHLVSFLMKATVWANVLEDGQKSNFVGVNDNIMDQRRPESDQKSDQKHQILDLIKRNPKISRAELSEKTGLHDSSVKRRLKTLVDEGFIKRIGPDKGGYWQLLK
ncbi:MAG: winged helix-turn-helix transcriptional regulator, partial [Candidatus Cryptobacteroides sp.]